MDSAAAKWEIPKVTMQPHQMLDAWVKQQRASQRTRRFWIGDFAAAIGVSRRSLRLWRIGEFRPIPQYRAAIERLTDGAIPASIWER